MGFAGTFFKIWKVYKRKFEFFESASGFPIMHYLQVVSLRYLKKKSSYEVDVLHADKHESIFLVDSIIFDGLGQACPK